MIIKIFIFSFLFSVNAIAQTNHIVMASVTTIAQTGCVPTACNGAIKAGDTITLASGERGPLKVSGLVGTVTAPIILRNDPNGNMPTTIRTTAGTAFVLTIDSVNHFVLDGTAKWSGAGTGTCQANGLCGIKVTIASGVVPTAFIKVGGSTKNFTMKGIEVDGKFPILSPDGSGIGLSVNDHTYKLAAGRTQLNPNEWRENILITNNYFHDMGSECLYVGPNYNTDGQTDLPLRNIEVSYNRVEHCVRDGIDMKSTIAGVNSIHHNHFSEIGIGVGGSAPDRHGIEIFEGYGDVYANRIEGVYLNGSPGGNCITIYSMNRPNTFGPFKSNIYNNVCIKPEKGGIANGRSSTADMLVVATITHNTVISPAENGISINANITGGVIRDNIIVDAGSSATSAPSGNTATNNFVGTIASQNFLNVAKKDFHLTISSPARNAGTGDCIPFDHDDISRPQGSKCDAGAYEFFEGATTPALKAPRAVKIQ